MKAQEETEMNNLEQTFPNYRVEYEPDRDKWSRFIREHPEGRIFQSPEMADLYKRVKRYKPVCVALADEADNIAALVLAAIQTFKGGPVENMTARSVVFAAPLLKENDETLLEMLLKAYDERIKREAIYSQFRNMWDQNGSHKAVFEKLGFRYEEHLDIHIDLTQSEEDLHSQVNKNRRHNIRRAAKKGISFKELTGPADRETVNEMIKNTYKRINLPIPDDSFFHLLKDGSCLEETVKYFGAMLDGEIISSRIVLCFKDLVYDWWSGTLDEHKTKYPNDLLLWNILLWGKEKGYKTFDFGGAGKPGIPYGVRDYKLKFGGILVNFGRYEKVHKPLMMSIGKLGFKLWQLLK